MQPKRRPVRDFGKESGGSPDADSWHAGQDRPKRVRNHQAFDLAGDFVVLLAQGGELLGEAGHDEGRSLRAGHDYRLLAECLNDLGGEALAHMRGKLDETVGKGLLAGAGKQRGRRVTFKQVEHGWMVQARSQDSFQSRMDLGKQTTNAVAGLRDLRGQIVIEAGLPSISMQFATVGWS